MNARGHRWSAETGWGRRSSRAFSLPEMMVTTVIFTIVIGGVVASNLFGMRMFTLTQTKLGNGDVSRRTLDLLVSDVRSAKNVQVGTGTLTTFAPTAANVAQAGNAIQIYPTSATGAYVRYYRDSLDQNLKRMTSGTSAPVIVAYAVSNSVVFTREDFTGTVVTNNQSHSVIGVTLQFSQLLFPPVNIGPTNYYDFYQLQAKIQRRGQE